MTQLAFGSDYVQLPDDSTGKKTGFLLATVSGGDLYLPAGVIVGEDGTVVPADGDGLWSSARGKHLSTPPTLSDGDSEHLQLDGSGRLIVTHPGGLAIDYFGADAADDGESVNASDAVNARLFGYDENTDEFNRMRATIANGLEVDVTRLPEGLEVTGTGNDVDETPIPSTDVSAYRHVSVQLGGSYTPAAGTIMAFEQSNDATSWFPVVLAHVSSDNTPPPLRTTTNDEGIFAGPLNAKFFRVRITAHDGGDVDAIAEFSRSDAFPFASLGTVDVAVTDVDTVVQTYVVGGISNQIPDVWVGSTGAANALQVGGNVAAGEADEGPPVKVGGVYNASLPTLSDGDRGDLQLDDEGKLRVTFTDAVALDAATLAALETVSVTDGGGSLTVDGTVAVTDGGGSLTVDGPLTDTQLRATPVPVSGTVSVTEPVTVDGEVALDSATLSALEAISADTEITTADLDTGGGTATRAVIGLLLAESGGPTLVGSANPLPVSDNGTTLSVDDGGGALTVDGTVAATQSGGWTVTVQDGGNVVSVDDAGATLSVDDGGGSLTVDGTVAISNPDVQYTEADTDSSITGTAILWEDTSDTLRAVSAAKPLPVSVIAALPAGSAAIGKLAANDGVDIGDVTINNASLTVTASDLDVRDLTTTDKVGARLWDGSGFYDGAKTGQLPTALSGGRLDVVIGAALPAGTNAIGKLAANSGVDIGDVDVTSVASVTQLPAALTGSGNLKVSIQEDGGAVIGVDDNAGSLTVDAPVATPVFVRLSDGAAAVAPALAAQLPSTLGQTTMSGSVSVTVASDQTDVPVDLSDDLTREVGLVVLADEDGEQLVGGPSGKRTLPVNVDGLERRLDDLAEGIARLIQITIAVGHPHGTFGRVDEWVGRHVRR